MPEETAEELMSTYSRSELDDIAERLGLDPKDYPNKEAIAKAIISARKRPPIKAKPKKEYPKRVGIKSVKALQAENEAAVKRIHADVGAQIEENEEAVKKISVGVKEQMKENEAAVKKIEVGVKEQVKENEAAVKKISAGVIPIRDAMHEKAKEIEKGVEEQAKKNVAYVREFYYG